MVYYIGAVGLILIGLYILLTKHNLIKMIIGLTITNTGVNLLLVSLGYIKKGTAPIFSRSGLNSEGMVDPTPQALALSLAIRLYQHYGTLDMRKIREQRW